MKCYRKNGSDKMGLDALEVGHQPSMKCYRKNGSDLPELRVSRALGGPQ